MAEQVKQFFCGVQICPCTHRTHSCCPDFEEVQVFVGHEKH